MKHEHTRGSFLGWIGSAGHSMVILSNSPKATEYEKLEALDISDQLKKLEERVRGENNARQK